MDNKINTLLILSVVVMPLGCTQMSLHEDYGKSVHKNTVYQTVNLSASRDSHPDVKMDGQKAAEVVDNYRSETPKVDATELTK